MNAEQFAETERRLGIVIPDIYKKFLLASREMQFDDGILYTADEIAERYLTLEFDKYAPDLIPIGNDNGGCELVMQSGKRITRFGFLDQGAIGTAKPSRLQNFETWYESGHPFSSKHGNEKDWSANAQIILKKCPADKAKTVMQIKNALHLDLPLSQLLYAAAHTPYLLTDTIPAGKAKKIIEENHLGEWLTLRFQK